MQILPTHDRLMLFIPITILLVLPNVGKAPKVSKIRSFPSHYSVGGVPRSGEAGSFCISPNSFELTS